MKYCNGLSHFDYGPDPYVTYIPQDARDNTFFRKAIWTGCYSQMTLMCIPQGECVGLEMHADTDQIIRVEHGKAIVQMGKCKKSFDYEYKVTEGDTIFVPACTWHNIINVDCKPLKLSSIYSPPHHPRGTVHKTKEDAE